MRMGVQQLKDFLDAPPAQPESASYSFVEEPYAAYLQAVAPTSQELALQRDNPPLALPRFILLFQGDWTPADRERTMASLKAQSYDRFQTATLPETGDGDYFLYLWPGDTLAPDALYHFARAAAGGADLIYGDEDFLYPHPPCCRLPFFKSAPSLITQSSFDMLSCGVAVHRNLLKQVGPMAGASAEARYAFNLKALAASRRAVHIPRPLYTLFQDRRPGPSAVALLETALGGQERVACGQWPGSFRVWAPVGNKPSFSIVLSSAASSFIHRVCDDARQKHVLCQRLIDQRICLRGLVESRFERDHDLLAAITVIPCRVGKLRLLFKIFHHDVIDIVRAARLAAEHVYYRARADRRGRCRPQTPVAGLQPCLETF